MSMFSLLDVAIGMFFVYLLLSLICSAIQEMLEAYLKMRARDLERGIRELLHDSDGAGLTTKIYEHPLIFGLFDGNYDTSKISGGTLYRGTNLPSYIPARNFAIALMDVMLPVTNATPSGAAGATAPAQPPRVAGDPVAAMPQNPVTPLRNALAQNPDAPVNKALLGLIDAAGNEATAARDNIEGWFNSSMDRVSGWYKRRAQWMIFAFGFIVAIAMNADTIAIATRLARDDVLRQATVAAAAAEVQRDAAKPQTQPAAAEALKARSDQLRSLGLPIGWKDAENDAVTWVLRVIGWVLTALAVSLGAPFWFDLLNKFMVIRSTVKPHEKSPEEPSQG